jgi:hypothetical protein
MGVALFPLSLRPSLTAHAGTPSNLAVLINQDRAAQGLPALAWSDCLASIAQLNAARIAAQGSLSHTNGPDVDMACGGGSTLSAGENIAYLSSGPNDATVNQLYMNSPGHRANILGNYQYVATAWVTTPSGYGFNAEEFLGAASVNPWPPAEQASFYFAEGFTGSGFTESLSLLMPNHGGTATVDYYTQGGHMGTVPVALQAGRVAVEDVLADVGPNQEVSALVSLPFPGVVERGMHFNTGAWYGSTDVVGVSAPATEWDFAEGSTLSFFSEYLTMQNPNPSSVAVTLNYYTSRTTVAVFNGDLSTNSACAPDSSCGVGRGIGGVSTRVVSSLPIIAERPFYVNGFSFGAGAIRDGHDAFGANAPAPQWNFAEGTTLPGFYEYLTLQNPNPVVANVGLRYMDEAGAVILRALTIGPQSRATVAVFDPTLGAGPGRPGVSTQVTADQPIVAERPMYVVHDFGGGPVAGAHVVVGSTSLGTLFGFAAASTLPGDFDYLTIQNPNASPAAVTVTYYTPTGAVSRSMSVAPNSRHTVPLFAAAEGVGPGYAPVGIVVSSTQPILVEKPTYSSNPSSYGATDTLGYAAGTF